MSDKKAEELAREIAEQIERWFAADYFQLDQVENWLATLLRSRMEERWIPVSERTPKMAELPCLYIDHAGKPQIGRPIQYDKCWMPLSTLPTWE